jgi:hypothetical protein
MAVEKHIQSIDRQEGSARQTAGIVVVRAKRLVKTRRGLLQESEYGKWLFEYGIT